MNRVLAVFRKLIPFGPDPVFMDPGGNELSARTVQDKNAAEEWVGMPQVEVPPSFRVVVNCASEEEQKTVLAALGNPHVTKMGPTWTCEYGKDRIDDVIHTKFVEEEA